MTHERDTTVSQRVILAIAEETGADPVSLDPLHQFVDPESLNNLFREGPRTTRSSGRVTFTYADHTVTVSHEGDVEITPREDTRTERSATDGSGGASRTQNLQ